MADHVEMVKGGRMGKMRSGPVFMRMVIAAIVSGVAIGASALDCGG